MKNLYELSLEELKEMEMYSGKRAWYVSEKKFQEVLGKEMNQLVLDNAYMKLAFVWLRMGEKPTVMVYMIPQDD